MTVAVVGAGFSGLLVAAELERRGMDVIVLEAEPDIGGVAATVQHHGFTLEPGVGSFIRPDPALDHYISKFDLKVTPAQGEGTRYLGRTDRLVTMPNGPLGLASWSELSPAGKVRALAEVSVTSLSENESVLDFFVRRFGAEAGGLAAHLAAAGVFAGDPRRLSMAASFPRAVAMEQSSGSLIKAMIDRRRSVEPGKEERAMFVPSDSVSSLATQLSGALSRPVRTGFEVSSVAAAGSGWKVTGSEALTVDQVVITVDTRIAATITPPILGPILTGRSHTPVAVVGLGSRRPMHLPNGFGALTHPDDQLVSRGVLFESSYAPHRAPRSGDLIKIIAGGAARPEAVDWSDDYLVRVVGGEVSSMLQQPIEADWMRVVRGRIPQYNLGHRKWLETVDDALRTLPGLHLTGWGYRGVGLAHLAADALDVATRIDRG